MQNLVTNREPLRNNLIVGQLDLNATVPINKQMYCENCVQVWKMRKLKLDFKFIVINW